MKVEYHRHYSEALGHDMEFKVYGERGKPLLAFPAQDGRFYDWEGFGMVEAIRHFLEAGKVMLFTVDGVDWESWTNRHIPPHDRARRHQDYDRYITAEFMPLLLERSGGTPPWTTGCSMGAFHAANFFFRHPDRFDGVIAMSGLYHTEEFTGHDGGMDAYYNSPLWYLPGLTDEATLERYRQSTIVFCVGQGRWEERMIEHTRQMQALLEAKGIPAWIDFWGHDVDHDWPWWRLQLPYFLGHLLRHEPCA
jgi:esterase/lipase superfamily enzyme